MDGERSIVVPVCEGSVVAEDGTTRVQHCVEGYQCIVYNLQRGGRGRVGREGKRENGREGVGRRAEGREGGGEKSRGKRR